MSPEDRKELFRLLNAYVDEHRAEGHQVWFHNRGIKDFHVQCFTCWPMPHEVQVATTQCFAGGTHYEGESDMAEKDEQAPKADGERTEQHPTAEQSPYPPKNEETDKEREIDSRDE